MADGSLCTLVTPLNPKSALKNSPDSAMQTNSHVELAPCGTAEPRRDAAMCLSPRVFDSELPLKYRPIADMRVRVPHRGVLGQGGRLGEGVCTLSMLAT